MVVPDEGTLDTVGIESTDARTVLEGLTLPQSVFGTIPGSVVCSSYKQRHLCRGKQGNMAVKWLPLTDFLAS